MPESRAKGAQHTLSWLLNEIIQQSPIGIAVIDADGFYRNVNAASGDLYGYTERKLESARAFTQSVLDGLSEQVCVIDERGLIVSVNRAWRAFNHVWRSIDI